MAGFAADVAPPWPTDRPSIYAVIAEHVARDTDEPFPDLPDAEPPDSNKIRFAPGALDGVFGHHASGGADSEPADAKIFAALEKTLASPNQERVAALYALVRGEPALGYIDGLLSRIRGHAAELNIGGLHALARWFALEARDTDAVKFAVAVLGVFTGDDDRDVFMTLGRHDEFTLYAAVALENRSSDPESDLWTLARHAKGWGRVNTVERLAETNNPDIKAWLLRTGFRNEIMDEYLAVIAARTGGLAEALRIEAPDDALLDGAAGIIVAMMPGGPGADIRDYDEAPEALESFVNHIALRSLTGERLAAAAAIERFLNEAHHAEEADDAWTADVVAEIRSCVAELMSRPETRDFVQEALEHGDRSAFWTARDLAPRFGIDPWPYTFARLKSGEDHWWHAMQTTDPDRVDQVVDLALKTWPLDELGTGPSTALGMGEDYRRHMALDFVVQDLRRFPGKGWPLVEVALRNPVVRCRNMAVNALGAWGRESWPDGASDAVDAAFAREPDPSVKERMQKLIAGTLEL